MSHVENVHGEEVHLGEFAGTVVNNADPLKLGRVTVTVPGLVEPESPWAFPIGGTTGGGKGKRGAHDPPAVGATVAVSFLGGNIDVPVYKGAWRGKGEELTALADVSAEEAGTKIKTYETDRYVIALSEVDGKEEVLILDKQNGNKISMKPSGIVFKSPSTKLGGDDAPHSLVLGEPYRSAEDALFAAMKTCAQTLAGTCTGVVSLPQVATAVNSIGPAMAALVQAVTAFTNGSNNYLSQQSRTK